MFKPIFMTLLLVFLLSSTVAAAARPTVVQDIRYSYNNGTVRLVVDVTDSVEFKEIYVENPSRLVVDIQNATLSPKVKKELPINNSTAKRVRVGQFDKSTVRVVVETIAEIKIFMLEGGPAGYRLVIDVIGENPNAKKPETEVFNPPTTPTNPATNTEKDKLKEEKERKEKEEKERLERERKEKEERDRLERERKEKEEKDRLEKERQEKDRLEKERLEKERLEKEEKERKAKEEKDRKERERQERLEKERKEKEEKERKEKERKEKERLEKEEKERKAKEEKERKERERQERLERERARRNNNQNTPPSTHSTTTHTSSEVDKDLEKLMTLKGKVIAIDPGHGGNDAGAIGPSGLMEKTVTLEVALELEKLLKAEGATVIMTRQTDKTVSPAGAKASAIEELQARCDVANKAKADIFISIHADSFTNSSARGTTGYYYSQTEGTASIRLAECIRKALCEQIKTPSRGTKPCNFYVVRNTDMAATLIELAFISNPEEEKIMGSREGVLKCAQGIFDGIEDYFG